MYHLSYPRHRQTPYQKQTVHSYALIEYLGSLARSGYTTVKGVFLAAFLLLINFGEFSDKG